MMIVLDRSCSMNKELAGSGSPTKWSVATEAVGKLTTQYAGKLDFGLILFPDAASTPDACIQDAPIPVNVGAGNEQKIVDALKANAPNAPCTTPIRAAVAQVSVDPVFAAPYAGTGRRSFALLITDGKPTCNEMDADVAGEVKALHQRGYATYVVGFGDKVSPTALDAFADEGGVPYEEPVDGGIPDGGTHRFYRADSAQALEDALDAIISHVAGEFDTCPGTPCPDNRCFVEGESCTNGFCQAPPPDLAGEDLSAPGGDGSTHPHGVEAGCACSFGATRTPSLPLVFLLLALTLAIVRRRARR
jgi:hypothetical protein